MLRHGPFSVCRVELLADVRKWMKESGIRESNSSHSLGKAGHSRYTNPAQKQFYWHCQTLSRCKREGLFGFPGFQAKSGTVHAIAKAGWFWAVLKHMAKVGITAIA